MGSCRPALNQQPVKPFQTVMFPIWAGGMPQTFDRSGEAGLGYAYQGDVGTFGIGGKHFQTNYGIPGVPPNADFANVPPTTSRIASTNPVARRGVKPFSHQTSSMCTRSSRRSE